MKSRKVRQLQLDILTFFSEEEQLNITIADINLIAALYNRVNRPAWRMITDNTFGKLYNAFAYHKENETL